MQEGAFARLDAGFFADGAHGAEVVAGLALVDVRGHLREVLLIFGLGVLGAGARGEKNLLLLQKGVFLGCLGR